jgi:hypothetical protein
LGNQVSHDGGRLGKYKAILKYISGIIYKGGGKIFPGQEGEEYGYKIIYIRRILRYKNKEQWQKIRRNGKVW